MSRPGLGVMISRMFGGRESAAAVQASIGKTIATAEVVKGNTEPSWRGHECDALVLTFADGARLRLRDDGQSCCEARHMTCDDDLAFAAGATLQEIELRDGPNAEKDYGDVHEQQFLVVTTSKGAFTVASHVEHNGYYGGFSIVADIVS